MVYQLTTPLPSIHNDKPTPLVILPSSILPEAWRSEDEEPIEVLGDQVIWPQGPGR